MNWWVLTQFFSLDHTPDIRFLGAFAKVDSAFNDVHFKVNATEKLIYYLLIMTFWIDFFAALSILD
jgi:hypothetical protein